MIVQRAAPVNIGAEDPSQPVSISAEPLYLGDRMYLNRLSAVRTTLENIVKQYVPQRW